LWSELTTLVWEDGSERDPSSLTVFWQEGSLKGCLRDKGNERVTFVSGPYLESVLMLLDRGLSSGNLDWRRDRDPGRGRRR
jgi:hypothetical protein